MVGYGHASNVYRIVVGNARAARTARDVRFDEKIQLLPRNTLTTQEVLDLNTDEGADEITIKNDFSGHPLSDDVATARELARPLELSEPTKAVEPAAASPNWSKTTTSTIHNSQLQVPKIDDFQPPSNEVEYGPLPAQIPTDERPATLRASSRTAVRPARYMQESFPSGRASKPNVEKSQQINDSDKLPEIELGELGEEAEQEVHAARWAVSTEVDLAAPETYAAAISSFESKFWIQVMKEEMASINENETWKVIPRNKGRRPIKSGWVFKKKLNLDNSVRFKARLVAKGYSQQPGVDYTETFSPVARYTTIRMLIAIAASTLILRDMGEKGEAPWVLHHMDFTTAFLNGDLEEEIFMEFPEGQGDSNHLCQLRKSLYGLKQSPRNWYRKLNDFLISIGFYQCRGDECLYYTDTCIIVVYVDDLVILGTKDAVKEVKATLVSSFKMTDLGELR
jgi:hypothetical protein